jgi:hypothetical protein
MVTCDNCNSEKSSQVSSWSFAFEIILYIVLWMGAWEAFVIFSSYSFTTPLVQALVYLGISGTAFAILIYRYSKGLLHESPR